MTHHSNFGQTETNQLIHAALLTFRRPVNPIDAGRNLWTDLARAATEAHDASVLAEYVSSLNEIQRLRLWTSLNYVPKVEDLRAKIAKLVSCLPRDLGGNLSIKQIQSLCKWNARVAQIVVLQAENYGLVAVETTDYQDDGEPRAGVFLVSEASDLREVLATKVFQDDTFAA